MKPLRITVAAVIMFAFCASFTGCDILFSDASAPPPYIKNRQSSLTVTEDNFSGYGFHALKTAAERQLYARIDSEINNAVPSEFLIDGIENEKNVSDVLSIYLDDHPEVFWVNYKSPYLYNSYGDGSMSIQLCYSFDTDGLLKAKKLFSSKVDEIINGAPENAGEYERELYVHDYLLDNCVYDDKNTNNQQTSYGALIEGKAVCEGYTRAFHLLCNKLGLECGVIQGDVQDDDSSTHIWNCVKLDGDWYQTDVTWDDSEKGDGYPAERYLYFNLTTEQMLSDHKLSPMYGENKNSDYYNTFVPECTAVKYNYFERNAMKLDSLENADIPVYLAEAAAQGKEYCDFVIGGGLDFSETFDIIVEDYAYDWIVAANEENGYEPEISASETTLSGLEMRGLVTFILRYE